MATAGDDTNPSESGGALEKLFKRPFGTENSNGMSSDEDGNSAVTGTTGLESISTILHGYIRSRFNIQQPTTIENLPEEILLNIFVRLLAKQLARMRSVSKSWNVVLSQPSFVKSHLHRSLCNNNSDRVLLFFREEGVRFTEYSFSDQSPHLEPTNLIKHIPLNLPTKVIGAVNGLMCLQSNYSDIHIWNPSLSAVSAVPPSLSVPSMFFGNLITSIRFGYDPKTDDYKLFNLSGVMGIVSDSVKCWRVQVYSMRKGSWELITDQFPSHITWILNTDQLCVDGYDGHIHWENVTSLGRKENTIVAFDLGSETFSEIPLPDSILDSAHIRHQLGVLSRKLCEVSWRTDDALEVWVMEEYGVPESWVKHHVFSQFDWSFHVYGFTLRNELLFHDTDGQLFLYDPNSKTTKLTPTQQYRDKIVEHVDSLFWV